MIAFKQMGRFLPPHWHNVEVWHVQVMHVLPMLLFYPNLFLE